MKINLGYSNDKDFKYWYIEVSTNSEENFDKLLSVINEKLEFHSISCIYCPSELDGYYADAFSISKDYMSKGEFMKVMRSIIKEARQQLKSVK